MKTIVTTLAAILLILSFPGCKKDSSAATTQASAGDSYVSFSIAGDDVYTKETTLTINGKGDIATNYGGYNTSYDITICNVGDNASGADPAKNNFQVYFNGNKKSQQHAGDDLNGGPYSGVQFQLSLYNQKTGKQDLYLFTYKAQTPGDLSITNYGEVGNWIEGDFSCKLVNTGDNNKVAVISKGHFKVPRIPDTN